MRTVRTTIFGKDPHGAAPVAVIELTSVIWREGDNWVSQCVELDVSSFGSSDEEANDELMDAVCAYLNTLEELGERQAVLDAKGVPVHEGPPSGTFHADVPREMLRREGAQIRPMAVPVSHNEPVAAALA